jgi:O-acetyl-ADP-ribose deacetylase (regulator of RNase III)|tara:strand:+ start:728 stop:1441 length:714 start_codon:yes stop_codon:yes gene_type:complete
MSIKILKGNIFTSKYQTLVNTVNCVGVMGAGIALEYRLRYPEMHDKYVQLCVENKIDIGVLWVYKSPDRWILNFPTKKHWKYPSKKEYLHAGLDKFLNTYKEKKINSIAFPLLGADKGGIPQDESLRIMTAFLEKADVEIEIYKYDVTAKDDLYDKVKDWLLSQDIERISKSTKLRKDYVVKVVDAMQSPSVVQLSQLAQIKGIGIKTLEKIFNLARSSLFNEPNTTTGQQFLLWKR